ncbi:MAG: L,D-transpeptidase family protein [Verrucomicrobia bacterium]|nr:L,D-transpeptidase family protein [Verrucomicrobiota bacterium]
MAVGALSALFVFCALYGNEPTTPAKSRSVETPMLGIRKISEAPLIQAKPPKEEPKPAAALSDIQPPAKVLPPAPPTPVFAAPPLPASTKPAPVAATSPITAATPTRSKHSPAQSEAWAWTVFRDDVIEKFRTELPEIGGLPLLHYAVLMDDEEWVNDLLARGADANERTPGGDTILSTAVRVGAAKCVRALLHAGAEVTQLGYEKQPPLALASLRRGVDIYRALIAAGADPNTRFNSPPTEALLDRVTIKDLKNSLEDDRGVTPLIACASRGDVEGAAELLRSGASPSKCTTRYHRYPINFAAEQGYLFLMRIILGRQPESEPEILVTIDLSKQRVWVVKEGVLIDTCSVSTGREGYNTPAGRYVITDKHRDWTSTLYHCAMPYFMRLNCSAIGLHSGYVTGRPASHGCIRLPYEKAKKFFGICNVGDEVQIVH